MKQELVRRAISSFIAVSITASHWGLFYTSGDIKQPDGGGEWRALRRLLLALIYLFVQREARRRPPDIRGFLSQQQRRSKGSVEAQRISQLNIYISSLIVAEAFVLAAASFSERNMRKLRGRPGQIGFIIPLLAGGCYCSCCRYSWQPESNIFRTS